MRAYADVFARLPRRRRHRVPGVAPGVAGARRDPAPAGTGPRRSPHGRAHRARGRRRHAAERLRLIVVEPTGDRASPVAGVVAAAGAARPGVPVVAYGSAREEVAGELLELARAGVSDVVLAEVGDDRARLAALFGAAVTRTIADDVLADLEPLALPGVVTPVIRMFFERAGVPTSVADAARSARVHRRTLAARLAAARMPSPAALKAWCRLLVAARLLEDPARSVAHTAAELGYPSATAFRNQLHRVARTCPRRLRREGGYAQLRAAFVRTVAGASAARRHADARHVELRDGDAALRRASAAA